MVSTIMTRLNQGWEWLLTRVLSNHENRIRSLEERMSATEDELILINQETDRLGTSLSEIAADVADLQNTAGNMDAATAARLAEIRARISAAADQAGSIASSHTPTGSTPDQPTG